ncbi:LuxR C-terminal-related transcriptional regulator [Luteipulveratus sp. YIM 133132]|uniref:helix-turn-helix transcriptional regulator n=1 Tax=Luteipulveratus flavus TaxID=3031728 RepID=UPI0023B02A06|nr:LuxR C-terminal-related transcriptional regulator [Luteipulveratus sp. YIM 133132]MDE9365887.1 LuxR C-terminal-related transcriptional regulator [Luteipulveratus sp. YIM 133132]
MVLRAVTSRAVAGRDVLHSEAERGALQQRRTQTSPGIDAVWLGMEEMLAGMSAMQDWCRHTVESVQACRHLVPADHNITALHRRSADRGIRSSSVVQALNPELPCRSDSCSCGGKGFYGEDASIAATMHLIDGRAARVRIAGPADSAVLSTDPVVVRNVRTLINRVQQASRPVLPRDRRRDLRPTLRQLRILHLMSYGLTDEKIAAELLVTSRTVRNDVAGLYVMFEVQSRFELGAAHSRWMAGR